MEPRDYSNGLEDVFQCAVFRDLASDSQLGNSSSGDGGRLQVRVSQWADDRHIPRVYLPAIHQGQAIRSLAI